MVDETKPPKKSGDGSHRRRSRLTSRLDSYLRDQAGEDARYRALIAALHEPVVTTTPEGQVTGFNGPAVTLFGDASLFGHDIRDVFPFVEPPSQASAVRSWAGTARDAATRPLDLEISLALLEQSGSIVAGVYVVHDVSHYAQLNRMREQLLYSVAHELRSPLSTLDSSLDILIAEHRELPEDDVERLLRTARRTSRRLQILMSDLLSAGSIQSGHFRVDPTRVQVSELSNEAVDIVSTQLRARGQELVVTLAEGDLPVRADARYVRQVLSNLLINASKYSPAGSVIHLDVSARGAEAYIEVQDHGPGIPMAQQLGLFERFYRADTESGGHGFGLGLAISKAIVEAHGGTIGVTSQTGEGTRVWFTLPLALVEPVARELPDKLAAKPKSRKL